MRYPTTTEEGPRTANVSMLKADDNSKLHGKRLLPALTSLRIFAAIHVVLFHCAYYMVKRTPPGSKLPQRSMHRRRSITLTVIVVGQGFSNILAAGNMERLVLRFVLSGFDFFFTIGTATIGAGRSNSGKFWLAPVRFRYLSGVFGPAWYRFCAFLVRTTPGTGGWMDTASSPEEALSRVAGFNRGSGRLVRRVLEQARLERMYAEAFFLCDVPAPDVADALAR